MEAAIVLTGLTVGGYLAWPVLAEHLQKLIGGTLWFGLAILALYLLAPYSSETQILWNCISQVPSLFLDASSEWGDGVSKLQTGYFNAFHQS